MMNNITNIFSDAQQNICSLYENLPCVTDCISGGENFALAVRDNLSKDQTALYLIAAGVALFGLSRLLAAPSKQQKVEKEEEVLELTPVKAPKQEEIEKVFQRWQAQSCPCCQWCDYEIVVLFPLAIG